MNDKIIPSYDEDGNLAGLFNVDDVSAYRDRVHAAAIHSMGLCREEAFSAVLDAVKTNPTKSTQILALVSAVVELVDILDASVSAVDAHGYKSREKILGLYSVEGGDAS